MHSRTHTVIINLGATNLAQNKLSFHKNKILLSHAHCQTLICTHRHTFMGPGTVVHNNDRAYKTEKLLLSEMEKNIRMK